MGSTCIKNKKMSIKQLKELNEQYRKLRNEEVVYRMELSATNGTHVVCNREVLNKIVDLLISESQQQIEKEVKE